MQSFFRPAGFGMIPHVTNSPDIDFYSVLIKVRSWHKIQGEVVLLADSEPLDRTIKNDRRLADYILLSEGSVFTFVEKIYRDRIIAALQERRHSIRPPESYDNWLSKKAKLRLETEVMETILQDVGADQVIVAGWGGKFCLLRRLCRSLNELAAECESNDQNCYHIGQTLSGFDGYILPNVVNLQARNVGLVVDSNYPVFLDDDAFGGLEGHIWKELGMNNAEKSRYPERKTEFTIYTAHNYLIRRFFNSSSIQNLPKTRFAFKAHHRILNDILHHTKNPPKQYFGYRIELRVKGSTIDSVVAEWSPVLPRIASAVEAKEVSSSEYTRVCQEAFQALQRNGFFKGRDSQSIHQLERSMYQRVLNIFGYSQGSSKLLTRRYSQKGPVVLHGKAMPEYFDTCLNKTVPAQETADIARFVDDTYTYLNVLHSLTTRVLRASVIRVLYMAFV